MKSKLTRYFTIGQVAHESKDGKYMMSDEVIPVVEKLETQLNAIIECYDFYSAPKTLYDLIDEIKHELIKESDETN